MEHAGVGLGETYHVHGNDVGEIGANAAHIQFGMLVFGEAVGDDAKGVFFLEESKDVFGTFHEVGLGGAAVEVMLSEVFHPVVFGDADFAKGFFPSAIADAVHGDLLAFVGFPELAVDLCVNLVEGLWLYGLSDGGAELMEQF